MKQPSWLACCVSGQYLQLAYLSSTGEDDMSNALSFECSISTSLGSFKHTHKNTHTDSVPPQGSHLSDGCRAAGGWRCQEARLQKKASSLHSRESLIVDSREEEEEDKGFLADHWLSPGSAGDGGMEGEKMGRGERKKEEHHLPVHRRDWTCGRLMRERREIEPPPKCEGEKYKWEEGGGGTRRSGGVSHTIHVTSLARFLCFSSLSLPKAKEHLQGCPLPR